MRLFTIRRCVFGAVVGACTIAVYFRFVEPWFRRWGATNAERGWTLPVDDLVEPGAVATTRAITVHAPIEAVWSWLVQIGQDRAGFYSYSMLENLVAAGMRNADAVNPGWQHHESGDTVWLADPSRWGERGRQIVALADAPRSLVLVSPADWERLSAGDRARGAWGFFLRAETEHRTRFVVRSSGGPVGMHSFDVLHFVMEQKMMRGLRDRAEADARGATSPR